MNKRKGITPIIAIVLLLMMTVAAGGLAWTFIQSTIEGQQTKTEAELEGMGMTKILEVIQIQNNTDESGWNITIRNPGDPVVLNWDNLLVKLEGRLLPINTSYTHSGVGELNTGEHTVLNINWSKANYGDYPKVVDTPRVVELEMNTDYRFSYSCKANFNNPNFC